MKWSPFFYATIGVFGRGGGAIKGRGGAFCRFTIQAVCV